MKNNEAAPIRAQSGSRIYQFGGGEGGSWNFGAEFKFAKIQNSHFEGGRGFVETNFQLLMLSSNLPKSKIPMLMGEGLVEF